MDNEKPQNVLNYSELLTMFGAEELENQLLNDQGAFPVHSNFVPIPLCLLSFCLLSFLLHMKSVLFCFAIAGFSSVLLLHAVSLHTYIRVHSITLTHIQLLCTGSEIIKYVLFANSNFRNWFGLDDSAPAEHRFSLPHTPHTHTHTHAHVLRSHNVSVRFG